MKKFFYLLPAIALVFAACSNEDGNNSGLSGNTLKVTAKEISNLPDNINGVELVADNGKVLRTAKWEDGFEIEFPESLSTSNLTDIFDYLSVEEEDEYLFREHFKISDEAAMITGTYLKVQRDSWYHEMFILGDPARDVWVDYVYSDRNFTVKGIYEGGYTNEYGQYKFTNKIDIKINKGWNRVAAIQWNSESRDTYEEYRELTSSIPSGIFWFYGGYY